MPDFATGIKMAKVNDLSVTAGTSLKYKIEFANQSSALKKLELGMFTILMAIIYKNAMFDLTTTNKTTVYTCPTNRTALIKSIQVNKYIRAIEEKHLQQTHLILMQNTK